MKFLVVCCAVLTLTCCGMPSSGGNGSGAAQRVKDPIVVLFIIDGVDLNTALTAAGNGANTLAALLRQGVTVERFYCTSPAARMQLPDGSLPWGTSTSGNVAMHTGCHLFESRKMDDIFLSARRAGIVSVFAGGAENYSIFDTASHLYHGNLSDEEVVERGLQHFRKDGARLIRLHLQRIRDAWNGPGDTRNPKSTYVQYFVNRIDPLLGKLKSVFESAGAWERTYLILGSDHGMGQTSNSDHPPSVRSSWQGFLVFYGPGVKRGAKIAYAESPDVAVMANYFLGLSPLKGRLEENVPGSVKGPTGTLLKHIFEGGPSDIEHPRWIERYLASGLPASDRYEDYRAGMLKLLAH